MDVASMKFHLNFKEGTLIHTVYTTQGKSICHRCKILYL